MTDKFNKFGFLAGKLFAKTVKEIIPILDAQAQSNSASNVSSEDKIKNAINILNSKNVSKYIEKLLILQVYESNEIIFTQGDYFHISFQNKVSALNYELLKELGIKEIETFFHFKYKEKSICILLANNILDSDGDTYELIVVYNNVCVLESVVIQDFDSNSSVYYLKSYHFLKSFKNGSWMDDLDYLIKNFNEFEKNRKIKEEENKLKEEIINRKNLADKLDLDPID